jgi:AcrR family transcriptional regulator
MGTRRDELLTRCQEYLLDHGVAEMSLRPIAAGVGTSARLLVYHFGSRDGLITAVMNGVRARLQGTLRRTVARPGFAKDPLLAFWKASTQPDVLRALGLLLEVQVLALRNPRNYRHYLDETSTSWLQAIGEAVPESKHRVAVVTVCQAVVDGLILDLLSTGDRRRTTEAVAFFRTVLRATVPAHRRTAHTGPAHSRNRKKRSA